MFACEQHSHRPWHLDVRATFRLSAQAEVVRAVEANLSAQLAFLPSQQGCQVTFFPLTVDCGGVTALFNLDAAASDDLQGSFPTLEDRVRHALARVPCESDVVWWVGPSAPLGLPGTLCRCGFHEHLEVVMVFRTGRVGLRVEEGHASCSLNLEFLSDVDACVGFATVMEHELGQQAGAFYRDIVWQKSWPHRVLVATYRGQPLAAGSLFWDGRFCGLFDVVVASEFRRLGVGSALLRKLVDFGVSEFGATLFCLSASSDEGTRIYERAGFQAVGWLGRYEPADQAAASWRSGNCSMKSASSSRSGLC
eukprot:TRINITY_DN56466_c0_g1_i1.p1 TRINITY_DN56466_c0_g1~~TRINITY_DN56466_c0_g1_i1.p1  ORF type:complete len:308 (+),score=27.97 TRINITY_DN56466_c0_g1_i1:76-999(+)